MTRSPAACRPAAKSYRSGGSASLKNVSPDWRIKHARGGPGLFPPEVVVTVKALACELPARTGCPLARWSMSELAAETQRTGLVASISGSTIWRWLYGDAIRPWFHRSWIFATIGLCDQGGSDHSLTSASGRTALTADGFVLSPMRRRAFKRAVAVPHTAAPGGRGRESRAVRRAGPEPTWPRYASRRSLAAAARRVSTRSTDSSSK